MQTCPHCNIEIRVRDLRHQGFFKNFRICPGCGECFTVDRNTKYRQAAFIVIAVISLVLTLLLYRNDSGWLIPAVISYVVLGLLIFWGNKKVFFVPYRKQKNTPKGGKMNWRKIAGFSGIAACLVFWLSSFALGALRPSYSHLSNTLGELGAAGTPNALAWNIIGFVFSGLMLAVSGGSIALLIRNERSTIDLLASILLVIAGLAVAMQGIIPADMSNGAADITSPYTRGHFISSLVSGAAWAIGVLLLAVTMKKSPYWHGWHIVNIVLVVLAIAASLTLRGAIPDGLAQRIGNSFFFLWFLLTSLKLLRLDAGSSGEPSGIRIVLRRK